MKKHTTRKFLIVTASAAIGALSLYSCNPVEVDEPDFEPYVYNPTWHQVKETRAAGKNSFEGSVSGMVAGKKVVAEIKWRAYNPAVDAKVKEWYGDMASPPPSYVVSSLKLSFDGKEVPIAKEKYRGLCSKWEPEEKGERMDLHRKEDKFRLVVNLGDGGESWASVYEVNVNTGKLISHRLDDGVGVGEEVIWEEPAVGTQ